jgi:hypothetical protein
VRGWVQLRTALGGWNKEVVGEESKIQEFNGSVGVGRRRTAIAKRLRRSTAAKKVGAEKRKHSSSPPSSVSSIRSAAPDPKRRMYKTWIVIADLRFYDLGFSYFICCKSSGSRV